MAAASVNATISMLDSNMETDKLTYEIFSILENKFLFGYDDTKTSDKNLSAPFAGNKNAGTGKVRILTIDAGGSTDGVLAGKSLTHLEATLRQKSGKPNAHIADFFDVVAGSGAGGVLAGLLFTRGNDGVPMFTAKEALDFVVENGRKISRSSKTGVFRQVPRPAKVFKKVFGDLTLKDTMKAVLIPCYDLTTAAPFVFSRADALEMDGCDFTMADVCGATMADRAVDIKSVDCRTKITAVGGGIAMTNPTAAAITHVLNNKQEFPFANGVEDLLVVSLGNGDSDSGTGNVMSSPAAFVKIAGDGTADMVDQAVSMAFGETRKNNYVRIQGNGIIGKRNQMIKEENIRKGERMRKMVVIAEEMLGQKNVECVLFQGKKLVENSNLDKLKIVASELIKEQERRKNSILPPVILKHAPSSPRTSSATTLSSNSSC
ncbi:PREDICTED: patatin-like protein 3 [Nicotiana attenuata]|uniref:Patatin n=1 Tax=Nicotiana attenuata TaxID=49451 RepID=A0A314KZ86_NICAT|nr:PREDICTED: patatin-like protein 3 [Nicotiana attenuata]OIT34716.1 patatin-like protein 7 [Nicotiana attenuata]